MKKSALTAGIALALAGTVCADTADALKDEKGKISYSIGADIGQKIKQTSGDLDAALIARGLKDAFDGKLALSEQEQTEALQTFQKNLFAKMQAREKELADKNKAASDKFLEENKKKEGVKTTSTGLQYRVIQEGKGEKPTDADEVTVHYTGKLADGTKFDSSVDRGEPATFGVNQVIPGWVEALKLMPKGSKWELVIPPDLAYGEAAPPVIGPNQVLVFEVELLDVKKGKKE